MKITNTIIKYKTKVALTCVLAAIGLYSLYLGITLINILYFVECIAAIGFILTLKKF